MKTYETNANGNRYFAGTAAAVARVAASWAKQGHEPKAYAKMDADDGVHIAEAIVTTAKATQAALLAAK